MGFTDNGIRNFVWPVSNCLESCSNEEESSIRYDSVSILRKKQKLRREDAESDKVGDNRIAFERIDDAPFSC